MPILFIYTESRQKMEEESKHYRNGKVVAKTFPHPSEDITKTILSSIDNTNKKIEGLSKELNNNSLKLDWLLLDNRKPKENRFVLWIKKIFRKGR